MILAITGPRAFLSALSSTSTTTNRHVFALPVRGGQYRTTRVSDVLTVVHGVPVFGELQPGDRKNREAVGKQWHMAALADHQLDLEGEYLPPLHVGHHDGVTTVERAGFFCLTDVRDVPYRGQPRSALHADLYVSPEVAGRIAKGELPYCSVEIGPDWHKPEIYSIALLDHEPPQFKFPLITLAADGGDGAPAHDDDGQFGARSGEVITFAYAKEAAVADQKRDEDGKFGDEGGSGVRHDSGDDAEDTGFGESQESISKRKQKQADEEGFGDGQFSADAEAATTPGVNPAPPAPAAGADPLAAALPEPEPTMREVLACMKEGFAMLAANQKGQGVAPGEGKAGPAETAHVTDDPPRVDPKETQMSRTTGGKPAQPMNAASAAPDAERFAALQREVIEHKAQIAALTAREAARKRETQFAADVATAERELAGAGFDLTDDIRTTLRESAKDGANALKRTVEIFKKHAIPDPPASLDAPSLAHGVGEEQPKEIEHFAKQGPDMLLFGRHLYDCWQQSVKRGGTLTFKTYCKAEGVDVPA